MARRERSRKTSGYSRGSGADAALVTPWGYNFQENGTQTERSYLYTDRPVYRPGDSVHIKGIVRQEQNDTLALPGPQTVTLTVRGPDNKEVLRKQLPLSAHGTALLISISDPMQRWATTMSSLPSRI